VNAYLTQPLRKKHGIDWHEEYILGLVHHAQPVRVSAVLGVSNEVMVQATSHKYLTQLINKGLLHHTMGDDKRIKMVGLTKKGSKVIEDIAHVSLSLP